jgi:hypothetical protein
MDIKNPVAKRIKELYKKKYIALNTITNDSADPLKLFSNINENSKNPRCCNHSEVL